MRQWSARDFPLHGQCGNNSVCTPWRVKLTTDRRMCNSGWRLLYGAPYFHFCSKMAAGHATFLSTLVREPSRRFSCSLFPSATTRGTRLVTRVKLPFAHTPCAALLVSPQIERENSVFSVSYIEAPPKWRLQNLEIREEKDAENLLESVRSKSKDKSERKLRDESILEILNDGVGGKETDISGKLPWMDPSLRYANVMWFRGAYNAQIFVSPGESEDSIIRRFRHAVSGAGVLRECYRRRYRETAQDVIKRKQRQAALHRKRRRQFDSNSTHAYILPRESPRHSKKDKKKKKESRSRAEWNAGKKGITEKTASESDDDDFWGYTEEEERK